MMPKVMREQPCSASVSGFNLPLHSEKVGSQHSIAQVTKAPEHYIKMWPMKVYRDIGLRAQTDKIPHCTFEKSEQVVSKFIVAQGADESH